jgi:hypothetical protein
MVDLSVKHLQSTYQILRECYGNVISRLNDFGSLRFLREIAILGPEKDLMQRPGIISRALDLLVRRIAAGLKIPEPALRMFQTANELSGLDRKTLPTELIPLNTMQISRGLLNFTLLQSLEGWVLPYWAERQYDPADAGFIPRSHLGLSINITRRNWTAVGNPSCNVEPVVDPAGAVMPLRNRWTSECWLKRGGDVCFPSRSRDVRQRLREGLPIVTTTYEYGEIRLDQTVYVNGATLFQEVSVANTGRTPEECTLAFAIRPFNAEGACLLREIRFEASTNSFIMDGTERFMLPGPPDSVHCSNHAGGDSADFFARPGGTNGASNGAACRAGLANGYAAYALELAPGESRTVRATMSLDGTETGPGDIRQTQAAWESLLGSGAEIITPDGEVNMILRASLSTLLLLTDGDSITPGPWTYHQFWFRDAAVMLRALDAFGFHTQARAVIGAFPSMQEHSGYFRSQQGEWDSNGQALWTVWQHAVLSHDTSFLPGLIDSLGKGALWIARKRREQADPGTGPGLMPPGLSAEHLGLADRYFWDNWWSEAGLEGYARVCRLMGMNPEEASTRRELQEYRRDVERAVAAVQRSKGINLIPAGPSRGIDCGMIGSCAPWYPLQQYPPGDMRMRRTLETLAEHHYLDGLFFQEFIHSGKNPYLTLQIAQAWLYAGERERFWDMFASVLRHASPTLNYPEAIHPLTGGGTMGDGHHGWAAAEIAISLRSAFVREMWTPENDFPLLVLLGGAPRDWFLPGRHFEIRRAPVPGGVLSLRADSAEDTLCVEIEYEKRSEGGAEQWSLEVPGRGSRVIVNGSAAPSVAVSERETSVILLPAEGRTVVSIERHGETPADHPANR